MEAWGMLGVVLLLAGMLIAVAKRDPSKFQMATVAAGMFVGSFIILASIF
jgi:hypothetical protein